MPIPAAPNPIILDKSSKDATLPTPSDDDAGAAAKEAGPVAAGENAGPGSEDAVNEAARKSAIGGALCVGLFLLLTSLPFMAAAAMAALVAALVAALPVAATAASNANASRCSRSFSFARSFKLSAICLLMS